MCVFIEWICRNKFVFFGNLYGGLVVVSYFFDDFLEYKVIGIYSKILDDEVFKYLVKVYVLNYFIMKIGEFYCLGDEDEIFKDGIINGVYWYDVEGGM